MKTMSVTDFKAHCLEMVSQVEKTGEPIVLTKRGKPSAMLGPAPAEPRPRWVLGKSRHTAKIVGDILEPLDVAWEALTDPS